MAILRSLAFVFALALIGSPLQPPTPSAVAKPCNQGDAQCKDVQPQSHADLQGSQASPLWVNVNCPGCAKGGTQDDANKPKDGAASDWRHDPNSWVAIFTLTLALIAVGQAILFFVQLRLMRASLADSKTAADAAKLAAEAAKQSAEVAVNSQRAWMLIEGDPNPGFDSWIFTFTAKNYGKSPAEVLFTDLSFGVLDIREDLPEEPPYTKAEVFGHREWVPPQEDTEVGSFYAYVVFTGELKSELGEIKDGRKKLWLYGVIRYRDTVSATIHETRFCYWRNIGAGLGLIMGGPAGYNQCT
jgi:hypothetical protein